jgi:hypothetical protein
MLKKWGYVQSESEGMGWDLIPFTRPEEVTEMTSVTPLNTIYSLIGIFFFGDN